MLNKSGDQELWTVRSQRLDGAMSRQVPGLSNFNKLEWGEMDVAVMGQGRGRERLEGLRTLVCWAYMIR